MPMIDVYAPAGTLLDRAKLVRDLATAVMTIERVPNIPLLHLLRLYVGAVVVRALLARRK